MYQNIFIHGSDKEYEKIACEKLPQLRDKPTEFFQIDTPRGKVDIRSHIMFLASILADSKFSYDLGRKVGKISNEETVTVKNASTKSSNNQKIELSLTENNDPRGIYATEDLEYMACTILSKWAGNSYGFFENFTYIIKSPKIFETALRKGIYRAIALRMTHLSKCHNLYAMSSAIIHYWMVKNNLFSQRFVLRAKSQGVSDKVFISENMNKETLEDFLKSEFGEEGIETVYDYIYYVPFLPNTFLDRDLIIKLVNLMLKDLQNNKYLQTTVKDSMVFLEADDLSPVRIIDKSRKDLCEAAVVMTSAVVYNQYMTGNLGAAAAMDYLLLTKDPAETKQREPFYSTNDSLELVTIKRMLITECNFEANEKVKAAYAFMLGLDQEKVVNLVAIETNSKELAKKLNSSNEKMAKLREKLDASRHEAKDLAKKNKKLEQEIADITKRCKSNIDPKQYEAAISAKESIQDSYNKLMCEFDELGRSSNKVEKECDRLEGVCRSLQADKSNLEDALAREKELTSELQTHRAFNMIPIECFVDAIKDVKVMVLGGNYMFDSIRKYGLDNIKLKEAGCKNISLKDVSNMDLVLIVTQYVDHSSIEGLESALQSVDVPMVRMNTTNTEQMILNIFKFKHTYNK